MKRLLSTKNSNATMRAKCLTSYVEDGLEYWIKGKVYPCKMDERGNYRIKTEFDTWGAMGPDYSESDFNYWFELV